MYLKIYLSRLTNSFKRNGFFKTLLKLPKKLFFVFLNLPFSKRNKLINKLILDWTENLPWNFSFIEGYAILNHPEELKKEKNALCFGIYDSVLTELALKELGYTVFTFDPTPITKKFFKQNPKFARELNYYPWAVWSEDGKKKFYYKDDAQKQTEFEGTLGGLAHGIKFQEIDCFSLNSIIKKLGLESIDYIKLDIEGSVPQVLKAFFSSKTAKKSMPAQMCFELEIPNEIDSDDSKQIINNIKELLKMLKKRYKLYSIPDDKKFNNLCVLAVIIH